MQRGLASSCWVDVALEGGGRLMEGFFFVGLLAKFLFLFFFPLPTSSFFCCGPGSSSFAQLRFLLCFFRAILPLPLSSCTFLNRGEGG